MFSDLSDFIIKQYMEVFSYPLLPEHRIYYLYLISAVVLAFFVYLKSIATDKEKSITIAGFARFLFPSHIWRHPSAWLDVRYFFFHQFFRLIIYGMYIGIISNIIFLKVGQVFDQVNVLNFSSNSDQILFIMSVMYMFFSIALIDFVSYWIHYAQHKLPILWEFHKVHHSTELMHPLSNYREHPVDNIAYAIGTGVVTGLAALIAKILFGYIPSMPEILGVAWVYFAFNFLGYNLRHSHIWLRWPGNLGKVFASPAHHQIHHSYYPEHINKNFSFIFPWWDSLFGTFCLPKTNENVCFGLSGDYQQEYKSCLEIYLIPLKNCFKMLFNKVIVKK
jgi:sterol desaturase/sphingolipid hydroxylase (fatty acid hydroxylase superfamily)